MHRIHAPLAAALALVAPAALAQSPDLGGPMKHIEVQLVGSTLEAHIDSLVDTPVLRDSGVLYTGGPAVLNGTHFNAQHGWSVGGFWSLPPGSFVWIEQIEASDGLTVYLQGTYAPIFSTEGTSPRIRWSGAMLHNWYSTSTPGPHQATYIVYLGDAAGIPTSGYEGAVVALDFLNDLALCTADFNHDAEVDILDFLDFLDAFGGCDGQPAPCPSVDVNADVNGDTGIDILDFLDFLDAFGTGTCP